MFPLRFSTPFLFFKDFIYLFIRDTQREAETQAEGEGRSRPHAGSPMWDSIPGPQDHDLSQKQMLHHRATLASQNNVFFLKRFYLFMHERHREKERKTETQAEGEADSMQGA